MQDVAIPEEGPRSPELPISSFLMNLLQTCEWFHARRLKSIYNYNFDWSGATALGLNLKPTVCQVQL